MKQRAIDVTLYTQLVTSEVALKLHAGTEVLAIWRGVPDEPKVMDAMRRAIIGYFAAEGISGVVVVAGHVLQAVPIRTPGKGGQVAKGPYKQYIRPEVCLTSYVMDGDTQTEDIEAWRNGTGIAPGKRPVAQEIGGFRLEAYGQLEDVKNCSANWSHIKGYEGVAVLSKLRQPLSPQLLVKLVLDCIEPRGLKNIYRLDSDLGTAYVIILSGKDYLQPLSDLPREVVAVSKTAFVSPVLNVLSLIPGLSDCLTLSCEFPNSRHNRPDSASRMGTVDADGFVTPRQGRSGGRTESYLSALLHAQKSSSGWTTPTSLSASTSEGGRVVREYGGGSPGPGSLRSDPIETRVQALVEERLEGVMKKMTEVQLAQEGKMEQLMAALLPVQAQLVQVQQQQCMMVHPDEVQRIATEFRRQGEQADTRMRALEMVAESSVERMASLESRQTEGVQKLEAAFKQSQVTIEAGQAAMLLLLQRMTSGNAPPDRKDDGT
jgi:hypothetical protein